jgi:hypothetical protein
MSQNEILAAEPRASRQHGPGSVATTDRVALMCRRAGANGVTLTLRVGSRHHGWAREGLDLGQGLGRGGHVPGTKCCNLVSLM